MNALADAASEVSDEEIIADSREAGVDLWAEGEAVRTLLRKEVQKYKKRKLDDARRAYEAASYSLITGTYDLPPTPQARRDLLAHVLTLKPQVQGMLTMQFRELDQLSDGDVESSLRKLSALGLLDDLERRQKNE
jgi:hypothetical protein